MNYTLRIVFTIAVLATSALHAATTVTFLESKDLHAHLVPHKDLIRVPGTACPTSDNFEAATFGQLDASTTIGIRGGVARLATLLNQIRATVPNVVAMNIGDTYHGGAEAFYTSGEAIVDVVNALGFDVGVPGNWDYAYGPYVTRKRYNPTGAPTSALPYQQVKPANIISKQPSFPHLAANVTLANLGPSDPTVNGAAFLPPTLTLTRGGVKIGIIGISSDIVAQMYQPLALGFTFTQGEANYVTLINTHRAALRAAGCQIVVVMSELGIQKNHALAQLIAPGVDVIFSAHTHELTRVPLTSASGALVVEAGNDGWLGRMDITVDAGVVTGRAWSVLPVTSDLAEDAAVKALVDSARAPFLVANPNLTDPSASGSGQKLTHALTASAGSTAGTLTRLDALESSFNNAFADQLRAKTATQLALTPGFRFDSVAPGLGVPLEDNTVSSGVVSWDDVYRFFPVVYTHATASVTGQNLRGIIESSLTATFSPDAWSQGGGWVDGFSGLHATLNLRAADGARVSELRLGNATGPLVQSTDVFTIAGCQRPTEASDVLCSYSGFTNKLSFTNPATGLPWTVVDMFADLLAQGPVPATTRRDLADTSGLPRWPVSPFVQPLNDDADNDSLSDEWERHYFGNLSATANGTANAAGITNFQAYAFGLSPYAIGSGCPPRVFSQSSQTLFEFWRPRPELRYSVTGSTDLQTWSPAPFTLPANAAPVQLNLTPLGLPRYFLRVTAQP